MSPSFKVIISVETGTRRICFPTLPRQDRYNLDILRSKAFGTRMFGKFQHSNIRFEVQASRKTIQGSLTQPKQLQRWLWMQRWEKLPEALTPGTEFTTYLGAIPIKHHVETVSEQGIRFLLSQGIDGFHEWLWDDGWIQSHIEGVSLLPINLGQTVSLLSLRYFVESQADQA